MHWPSTPGDEPFTRPGANGRAVKSDIRVCSAWAANHERPVYTLGETCPACGEAAVNSAPAPYSPEDPYAEYRRALKRRDRE